MRLPRLLLIASVVFSLSACIKESPLLVRAPKEPLPAEYTVRCPTKLPAPKSRHVDHYAEALDETYLVYGTCAGRMADLLDWLDGGQD